MSRGRAVLAVAIVVSSALLTLAPTATAAAPVEGCAKLDHRNSLTPSHQTQFKAVTDSQAGGGNCEPSSYSLLEAHCLSFTLKFRRDGASAPANPAVWEAYWYYGTTENDHNAAGSSSWAQYIRVFSYTSNPDGQSIEVCATTTGISGGETQAGVYRLVLRTCTPSSARTTCNGGTNNVDINSDVNAVSGSHGTPGIGFTATGNPAGITAAENPHIMDPLWVLSREEYELGEAVHFFIHSELDNGSARTGGASNITIFIQAPDGTYPVNNATVTEILYPADHPLKGNYRYTYAPSSTGLYNVTVQTVTSKNETRTSKPWSVLVVTPKVGDLTAYGAYSWDTHDLAVTARVVDVNGTARSGLEASIVVRLFAPDGTLASSGAPVAGNLPGTYVGKTYLGIDPQLGPWTAFVEVPAQGNGGGNLTAVVPVVVGENLTLRIEDSKNFLLALAGWMNASFAYSNQLLNDTSSYRNALQNATTSYSNELTNATSTFTNTLINTTRALDLANFTAIDGALEDLALELGNLSDSTAPTVDFTVTGDPAPDAGVYVGRAARFDAVSNGGPWASLILVWDFGDNTTTQGPFAYHEYEEAGNYTVRLYASNAMGNATTTSKTVRVNTSTPVASITGAAAVRALGNVTFRGGGSYDDHSTIVEHVWEVDPQDLDLGWFGVRHVNKGYWKGENFTFVFTTAGAHTVQLTVKNAIGETNTTRLELDVGFPLAPGETAPAPADLAGDVEDNVSGFLGTVTRILQFLFG